MTGAVSLQTHCYDRGRTVTWSSVSRFLAVGEAVDIANSNSRTLTGNSLVDTHFCNRVP